MARSKAAARCIVCTNSPTPGDVGEPRVPERGEVLHRLDDDRPSSCQTAGIARFSSGPPTTTAGSPRRTSSSTRGSSTRRSTMRTPSTRCSPHQRRYTAISSSTSWTSWIVSAIERSESSSSTPAMNSMKNGSSASVRAGRASTSPHASARAADSARAARFGYQPSSCAIARIRSRVSSETPGRPFSAYETAPFETPARSAMSRIVTRPACVCSAPRCVPACHERAESV